jgi:putative oxidoreductase
MKNLLSCCHSEKLAQWAPLVLRIVAGVIFVVHGYQKLSGGVAGVGGFFASVGILAPLFFAYIVTYVEFLGGIALILGFLTHLAATLLAINMIVAMFVVHLPKGFSVAQGGYEFVLLLLAVLITIGFAGPGSCALDGRLRRKASKPSS